jgi:putative NIF3 family GTP cyclohydrolase 1 type 2
MTAREIVDLIKKNVGVPWNENTFRDIFKVGNPDIQVKYIAVTCMSTLDEIQRAHAAGANLVITHEPTFWSDSDSTKDITEDPVYKFKSDYCLKNDVVVWRFHDHWHARKPDMEYWATERVLGFADADPAKTSPDTIYTVPPIKLSALAADMAKRIGSKNLRVVGDPNATVSKIIVGVGSGMPRISPDVDVVIGGEGIESDGALDNTEYVRDAVSLGMTKGLIILGHIVSEEPGMDEAAKWLRTFITDIPVKFIPAGEPFMKS